MNIKSKPSFVWDFVQKRMRILAQLSVMPKGLLHSVNRAQHFILKRGLSREGKTFVEA